MEIRLIYRLASPQVYDVFFQFKVKYGFIHTIFMIKYNCFPIVLFFKVKGEFISNTMIFKTESFISRVGL